MSKFIKQVNYVFDDKLNKTVAKIVYSDGLVETTDDPHRLTEIQEQLKQQQTRQILMENQ